MNDEKSTVETLQNRILGLKEAVVGIPAVVSLLAVTLDVGFFYAVDLTFFTFFSLSEHVVFAFLMMPFAIALLLVVAFIMTLKRPAGQETPSGIRLVWWLDRILYLVLVVAGCWLLLRIQMYSVLGMAIVIGVLWRAVRREKKLAALLGAVASVFLMSLMLGADVATGLMDTPDMEHIIKTDNNEVRGVVLRSGDRGILFFNPSTKNPTLVKWDQIRSVTSVAPIESGWTKLLRLLLLR